MFYHLLIESLSTKSYCEQDKENDWAYSREIVRQSGKMLQSKLVLPAWP